jgi:hypothetical protein
MAFIPIIAAAIISAGASHVISNRQAKRAAELQRQQQLFQERLNALNLASQKNIADQERRQARELAESNLMQDRMFAEQQMASQRLLSEQQIASQAALSQAELDAQAEIENARLLREREQKRSENIARQTEFEATRKDRRDLSRQTDAGNKRKRAAQLAQKNIKKRSKRSGFANISSAVLDEGAA